MAQLAKETVGINQRFRGLGSSFNGDLIHYMDIRFSKYTQPAKTYERYNVYREAGVCSDTDTARSTVVDIKLKVSINGR